jgi:hypothetical protein
MTGAGRDRGMYWILDANHRPVPADQLEWARWFGNFENRRVAETFTEFYRISTVFLGLDHGWGKGPPITFETMAFEKEGHEIELPEGIKMLVHEDIDCVRYSSWDDAVDGHHTMVRRILKMEADAAKAVIKARKKAKHE